ncbi:unnamed protein product [Closterium sp. Naga37s-1]|nr:unnamed protein product [Closterium sp. Naga37s-1]
MVFNLLSDAPPVSNCLDGSAIEKLRAGGASAAHPPWFRTCPPQNPSPGASAGASSAAAASAAAPADAAAGGSGKLESCVVSPYPGHVIMLRDVYIDLHGHVFNSTHRFVFGGGPRGSDVSGKPGTGAAGSVKPGESAASEFSYQKGTTAVVYEHVLHLFPPHISTSAHTRAHGEAAGAEGEERGEGREARGESLFGFDLASRALHAPPKFGHGGGDEAREAHPLFVHFLFVVSAPSAAIELRVDFEVSLGTEEEGRGRRGKGDTPPLCVRFNHPPLVPHLPPPFPPLSPQRTRHFLPPYGLPPFILSFYPSCHCVSFCSCLTFTPSSPLLPSPPIHLPSPPHPHPPSPTPPLPPRQPSDLSCPSPSPSLLRLPRARPFLPLSFLPSFLPASLPLAPLFLPLFMQPSFLSCASPSPSLLCLARARHFLPPDGLPSFLPSFKPHSPPPLFLSADGLSAGGEWLVVVVRTGLGGAGESGGGGGGMGGVVEEEEEIERVVVERFGSERVESYQGHMGMDDVKKLFNRARLLIGPSSLALSSLLFLPFNAVLLELLPPPLLNTSAPAGSALDPEGFGTLAAAAGIVRYAVPCDPSLKGPAGGAAAGAAGAAAESAGAVGLGTRSEKDEGPQPSPWYELNEQQWDEHREKIAAAEGGTGAFETRLFNLTVLPEKDETEGAGGGEGGEGAGGGVSEEGSGNKTAEGKSRAPPLFPDYSDHIPGTRLHTKRQVVLFNKWMECVLREGRWVFNATPRTLPWEYTGFMNMCDHKQVEKRKGKATWGADELVLKGTSPDKWTVRETLKYEYLVPEDKCGAAALKKVVEAELGPEAASAGGAAGVEDTNEEVPVWKKFDGLNFCKRAAGAAETRRDRLWSNDSSSVAAAAAAAGERWMDDPRRMHKGFTVYIVGDSLQNLFAATFLNHMLWHVKKSAAWALNRTICYQWVEHKPHVHCHMNFFNTSQDVCPGAFAGDPAAAGSGGGGTGPAAAGAAGAAAADPAAAAAGGIGTNGSSSSDAGAFAMHFTSNRWLTVGDTFVAKESVPWSQHGALVDSDVLLINRGAHFTDDEAYCFAGSQNVNGWVEAWMPVKAAT